MRLSDAIATGRVLLKPRAGYFLYAGSSGCALGMAGLAGGLYTDQCEPSCIAQALMEKWPWAFDPTNKKTNPCDCTSDPFHAAGVITHIFDCHVTASNEWTLDRLIDWVRSVEPVETAPVETTEEKVITELAPSLVNEGQFVAQKS